MDTSNHTQTCLARTSGPPLLREDGVLYPEVDVYAVASFEEEIGSRGVQIAAFFIGAQMGLAVNMGQVTDYPDVDAGKNDKLEIGKGLGIDRRANTHHAVFDILVQATPRTAYPIRSMPRAEPRQPMPRGHAGRKQKDGYRPAERPTALHAYTL